MNDFLSFEITDWMQEDLHLKEGSLVLYAILFSAGKGEPVKIECPAGHSTISAMKICTRFMSGSSSAAILNR